MPVSLDFEKPLAEIEQRIEALRSSAAQGAGAPPELQQLESRANRLRTEIYDNLSTWQRVQLSRHPDRPYFLDYARELFDEDFVELHGDRRFADDPAIVSGFALFQGRSVAIIGHQKGRTTKQKLHRNFGMAQPEGYRKACRVMELAQRAGRPVLTFIDTPGAYPGIGAEERGQSEAIGYAISVMARLRVPVIATVIGEGGSGGALALGVANRVLMLEHSTYSVITPEGCASILWRDGSRAADAAQQLKLCSGDAKELGVVDEIIAEPLGGAHRDLGGTASRLEKILAAHLDELSALSEAQIVESRYQKFRHIGRFSLEHNA